MPRAWRRALPMFSLPSVTTTIRLAVSWGKSDMAFCRAPRGSSSCGRAGSRCGRCRSRSPRGSSTSASRPKTITPARSSFSLLRCRLTDALVNWPHRVALALGDAERLVEQVEDRELVGLLTLLQVGQRQDQQRHDQPAEHQCRQPPPPPQPREAPPPHHHQEDDHHRQQPQQVGPPGVIEGGIEVEHGYWFGGRVAGVEPKPPNREYPTLTKP